MTGLPITRFLKHLREPMNTGQPSVEPPIDRTLARESRTSIAPKWVINARNIFVRSVEEELEAPFQYHSIVTSYRPLALHKYYFIHPWFRYLILSSTRDAIAPLSSLSLNTDTLLYRSLDVVLPSECHVNTRRLNAAARAWMAGCGRYLRRLRIGQANARQAGWRTANRPVRSAVRRAFLTRVLPLPYCDDASPLRSGMRDFFTEHFRETGGVETQLDSRQ